MRCLVLLVLLVGVACQPPKQTGHSGILNVDSLLNAQINVLGTVTIDKTLRVDDSIYYTKATRVKLDDEMAAFRGIADINRPIYRGQYDVTTLPDKQSNLTVRAFQAKAASPVTSLYLFYLDDIAQLKRMEAILVTKDFYHSAEKKLTLEFSLLGETPRLESFTISGSQQYFWSAPRHFSVHAVLR